MRADEEIRGRKAADWLFPDPALLRKVERMTVAAKSRVRGKMQGKRRSRTLGSSLEFADYRPYAPGDDIRRLDWNVYGRTGRAYVRQFWDEQEITVTMYVDVSRSMRLAAGGGASAGFGGVGADEAEAPLAPESSKLAYALRLAACVGYAGLAGEDRVGATGFAEGIASKFASLRGRGSAGRLFAFLAELARFDPSGGGYSHPAAGGLDMSKALSLPEALPRRSGQTWLFTDGLYETGIEETLQALLAAGQDVVFVQLLGPEELRPELAGELKLIDSETGSGKEVAIAGGVLRAYRAAVDEHCAGIRRMCAKRGFAYVFADTSRPVEETVVRSLLGQGLLKG
ncbi:MAG TPA: DUF58 domain-containing protein [Paenibacillus sp.]|uniref:DUF58 domain-containing protein n=1 Tax=Paenibacillus sp. TaxID=58172 RepID=UPI0028D3D43B|nr:DUF58 domain-containing protein [Paenibacillus sp.]HUC91239.1 DUF58 domain-containing protein [Paenibacillus sp.]